MRLLLPGRVEQVFLCLAGWVLQEGPEEEDGGGVQEGQLGLRSQERRQGEHFLAAPVTSDLRARFSPEHNTHGTEGGAFVCET